MEESVVLRNRERQGSRNYRSQKREKKYHYEQKRGGGDTRSLKLREVGVPGSGRYVGGTRVGVYHVQAAGRDATKEGNINREGQYPLPEEPHMTD